MKWILCDLDGCISPEESVAWDLDLFHELARTSRAASAGEASHAPLALCTGRPQPYVEALMKVLDIRAPAVCENGAVLYSLHDNRAWYGPGVTQDKILGLRAVRAHIEAEILPQHPDVVYQVGKEAQMSLYCEHPEVFAQITPRIEAFVAARGGPALVITLSHYYLNISLAGVDKGTTVRALLEMLGCSRAGAAGIGDTEGDLPLREAVQFFACPANARASVKAVADYVSPFPTVAGVLDILRQPALRRS